MQQQVTLKLLPSEAASNSTIIEQASFQLGIPSSQITGFNILKRSLDARRKQPHILLTLQIFIDEPFQRRSAIQINLRDVSKSKHRVIIVGAGPAGLFAALKLLEAGIQPIILERGKDVRARRRDLAILNKEGQINPESNYCFGEGGAGTYSDGKLYTRSKKRGDVNRILNILVQFGAEVKILADAHPHIGTNKLPLIISSMREKIILCGGQYLFNKKLTDFTIKNDLLSEVQTSDGALYNGDALVLATGHSARDIFLLLHDKKIQIEFKPFALGVRIEHPQSLIDRIQYDRGNHSFQEKGQPRSVHLPPASYNLVQQVNGKGVFSFCMCPGGIIAPAATSAGELVVNGWSPSKRNNPFANSGIVASVEMEDIASLQIQHGPLAGMYFQKNVEERAFEYGGGKFVAPAQRMIDFVHKKVSSSLPACSYLPGINPAQLSEVLPGFIYSSLKKAFVEFGKKMKGYYTNDAVVVATESRTSSPVRIPRDMFSLHHPQVKNLYPCGEGAGYAGGIVSAAMDGERVAAAIIEAIRVKS